MGHRLTRIYTRTGDDGSTGLGDGQRVDKDDLRVCAFGDVDELNSAVGLVLAQTELPDAIRAALEQVQHDLFNLGGELCMPGVAIIQPQDVTRLEQQLDALNAELPPLRNFILPGGGPAAAHSHLARTICRRAERSLVSLSRRETVRPETRHYLNRLSDLLFVMARALARSSGHGEVLWQARPAVAAD
ncbi:cob(I)yrinic acid a,c-diamide adenosyltransferase [Frateuria aurantia]